MKQTKTMNSIHFVLEKIETNDMNKVRKWQQAVSSILGESTPKLSDGECPEAVLLIRGSDELQKMASAIMTAEQNYFPYKLVFNGDGGEWHRKP